MRNENFHPAPEEIEAFAADSLSAAERTALESHLAGCVECAAEVEEWRALFAGLAALPHLDPAPGLADRIMAEVRLHQPWHQRFVALLSRLIPTTTGGWFLATAFLALPLLVIGGTAAWLFSRPGISIENLRVVMGFQIEEAIASLIGRIALLLLENETALQILSGLHRTMISLGGRGIGIAALLGAATTTISVWIIYRNLFRGTPRGGSYATT